MWTFYALLMMTIVQVLVAVPSFVVDQHGRELPSLPTDTVPSKCNFYCTRMDLPICASNGQCMQLFESKCAMSGYNCEHPNKPFVMIADSKCKQSWATLCAREELGDE